MAAISVTSAWLNPAASLMDGQAYVVQNRTTGPVQFYEGGSFDATVNENDGIILVSLHDGGSGPNHMLWTFNASNEVRVRMIGGGFGGTNNNLVEFALSS